MHSQVCKGLVRPFMAAEDAFGTGAIRPLAAESDGRVLFVISVICDIMTKGVNMSPTVSFPRPVHGRINENGRIVIPAALREEMGIRPGDAVLMEVEDGVLRVESHIARIRRIQSEVAKYAKPCVLASDELIAERLAEARREEEEMARDREIYQERLLKAAQVA